MPAPPPYVLPEPPGMSGSESTSAVERVLARVSLRRHITLHRAFLHVAGPFPVAGPAGWSNDWHAFRPCPFPHLHEGLDIFAARGTPAVAAVDGVVSERIDDAVTGLGLVIDGPNGIQYFYAHLDAFAGAIDVGTLVRRGQIVGFVGNTGDASGGSTHLHFEVRPGGFPMPPKPLVDRWLLLELRRAREMLRMRPPAGSNPLWYKPLPSDAVPPGVAVAQPTSPFLQKTATAASPRHASAAGPVSVLSGVGSLLFVAFFLRRRRLGTAPVAGSDPRPEPP